MQSRASHLVCSFPCVLASGHLHRSPLRCTPLCGVQRSSPPPLCGTPNNNQHHAHTHTIHLSALAHSRNRDRINISANTVAPASDLFTFSMNQMTLEEKPRQNALHEIDALIPCFIFRAPYRRSPFLHCSEATISTAPHHLRLLVAASLFGTINQGGTG